MTMSLRVGWLAWLLLFWAASSAVAGEADAPSAPLRAWDDIVSTDLLADIADFRRDTGEGPSERVYSFLAVERGERLALSVTVAVAPAGSRLSAADWQAAVAAADAESRARDFPEIGARARAEVGRFSPDGALSDVTFTTGDGFFDVAVSVFEASGSTARPSLTAEDVARRINTAYAAGRK